MAQTQENVVKKAAEKVNVFNLQVKNIDVASTIRGQNVKIFLNAINNLRFTDNTELQFTANGLKFIAEESQYFQGCAYFFTEFFQRYHYVRKNVPVHNFRIDVSAVADFFSAIIDNDQTVMKIIYYGQFKSVAFILSQFDSVEGMNETASNNTTIGSKNANENDNEIVTEYIIKAKNSINPINFEAIKSKNLSKIMLSPIDFNEIIQDLDRMPEELQIKITSAEITFKSVGIPQCNTQISFASDHKIFKAFEHIQDTKYRYKFICFRQMLKSLSLSSEVCLETRENGLLRVMLSGKVSEGESLYFDFNIIPNVDDDDEILEVN